VHVSGGRAIKQWEPDRFGEVARRLAKAYGAAIVLTGSPEVAALVATLRSSLPDCRVIDVSGDADLPTLAAILERLDVFVTGDTGPMHLAGAVGTPVVAIFGPSDPARYALRGPHDRLVRVDLPCSPCNRIRRPPERCVGHTPDCLASVPVESVFEAAVSALTASGALGGVHDGPARPGASNSGCPVDPHARERRRYRRVELDAYLTGAQQDAAATAAGAWIKNVRNARVDGAPFRRRFTYRDDSLWWFAELYLHKQQVVLNIFKTVAALDALLDREQPSAIGLEQADPGIAPIVAQFAVARGVQFSGLNESGPSLARLAAMDARASWLHAGALASRTRRHPIASRHRTPSVLAFVHRAFWRTEADDGTAEQYIGPVLKALEGRLPDGGLQ
jgi:hypothetical protein